MSFRRPNLVAGATAVALGAALGGASAASAAPSVRATPAAPTSRPIVTCPAAGGAYPYHPCTIAVSITIVLPGGGKITFSSFFFLPFEKGHVFFYSSTTASGHAAPREVGTFTADAHGAVSGSVALPSGLTPGAGRLVFTGDKGTQLTAPLTVAPTAATAPAHAAGALPFTGLDVAGLTLGGLALLGAGGTAVVAGRRRRAAPAA